MTQGAHQTAASVVRVPIITATPGSKSRYVASGHTIDPASPLTSGLSNDQLPSLSVPPDDPQRLTEDSPDDPVQSPVSSTSNVPNHPTSNPKPSLPALVIDGHTLIQSSLATTFSDHTINLDASEIVIDSQTILPGSAAVLNGHTVSLNRPAVISGHPTSSDSFRTTADPSPDAIMIDSHLLAYGSSGTVIADHTVSYGSEGFLVDGSTEAIPTAWSQGFVAAAGSSGSEHGGTIVDGLTVVPVSSNAGDGSVSEAAGATGEGNIGDAIMSIFGGAHGSSGGSWVVGHCNGIDSSRGSEVIVFEPSGVD